jgi:hypothetical protein
MPCNSSCVRCDIDKGVPALLLEGSPPASHVWPGRLDIRHRPAGTAWFFAGDLLRLSHSSTARTEPSNISINAICTEQVAGDEHWNRTEAKQNRRAPVASEPYLNFDGRTANML